MRRDAEGTATGWPAIVSTLVPGTPIVTTQPGIDAPALVGGLAAVHLAVAQASVPTDGLPAYSPWTVSPVVVPEYTREVLAWEQAGLGTYFVNSVIITVPTVLLTLLFASLMAFAVSRFSWRFNITLLIMFTAGNLLPPQVLAAPLFSMFKFIPLPLSISDSGNFLNTYYSVIMVNTAFQIGFCTFVLSNYMKALPQELTEAALVDGAGVWKQYYTIVMPLCRPALAALATLEVIFIYNEFFWPLLFIQSGSRLPITTGIKNLQGQFFSDYNLIAAGATFTIIPTLIIYLLLQRHFVAGLTLGASKG